MECNGPRCAAHHHAEKPNTIVINEAKVRKDPNSLPDEYARQIKMGVHPFDIKELDFCCGRCAIDYLQYEYVEELSPREKARQAALDLQAVKEKETGQLPLPFPIDPIGGTVEGLNPPGPKYM
jgi:hypothetical protein